MGNCRTSAPRPSGFPVTFNAATLNVDLNLKASDCTYANYATQPNQGLTVQTGPLTTATLADTLPVIDVNGTVNVNVDGFVQLTNASFALYDSTLASLTVTNGTTPTVLTNANLLTFGVTRAILRVRGDRRRDVAGDRLRGDV